MNEHLNVKIARAFGLAIPHLQEFTITCKPQHPPMVTAQYRHFVLNEGGIVDEVRSWELTSTATKQTAEQMAGSICCGDYSRAGP